MPCGQGQPLLRRHPGGGGGPNLDKYGFNIWVKASPKKRIVLSQDDRKVREGGPRSEEQWGIKSA